MGKTMQLTSVDGIRVWVGWNVTVVVVTVLGGGETRYVRRMTLQVQVEEE